MRLPEIRSAADSDVAMPVEVSRLEEIAYNLWWTWSPRAHRLFDGIDPERWRHYHNPLEILTHAETHRWERLLLDRNFMRSYRALVEEFDAYMTGPTWFREVHGDYEGGPIAYFSTEYAWHESLAIYSGGLGVLSGDTCKSASDLGLPFVAVGLMYRRGFFGQTIDADGLQQHHYPDLDLRKLPVRGVVGRDGRPLRVSLRIAGRPLALGVFQVRVGRVPVLLLDSHVPENEPADRPITSILYVQGREMRLIQEIVLGMGGVRALRALDIAPSVWHLNEGHSAFLALERIRERVARDKIPFAEALRRTSGNSVFTTHTPVPAGNERFEPGLIRKHLAETAGACGVGIEEILALGRSRTDAGEWFNLTALAIRTSSRTNGVSEMHGRVAGAMWKDLLAEKPDDGRTALAVTNGVHVPTWIGPEMGSLIARHLEGDVDRLLLEPGFPAAVESIPDEEIWEAHRAQKQRLVSFARERTLEQFARHGRPPDELRRVSELLDPDVLTLGFARRFATYKRARLLFSDPARLAAILSHPDRPMQILFAGRAHPADGDGKDLIRTIFHASIAAASGGRILFLENYDLRIARFLVQGVDVWLNTPRRPQEASGTSGMKAAVSGGLNLSVLDGWWCEGFDPSHGWAVGETKAYSDPDSEDREDAASLYRTLEEEIAPCYYRRDPVSGLPIEWIARMKRAIASLAPRFSTDRMLRDYVERLYLPASEREGWGADPDDIEAWS